MIAEEEVFFFFFGIVSAFLLSLTGKNFLPESISKCYISCNIAGFLDEY